MLQSAHSVLQMFFSMLHCKSFIVSYEHFGLTDIRTLIHQGLSQVNISLEGMGYVIVLIFIIMYGF